MPVHRDQISLALSQNHEPAGPVTGRKVAILAADGTDDAAITALSRALAAESGRVGMPASKPMAGALDGVVLLDTGAKVTKSFTAELIDTIAAHRHFNRPVQGIVV